MEKFLLVEFVGKNPRKYSVLNCELVVKDEIKHQVENHLDMIIEVWWSKDVFAAYLRKIGLEEEELAAEADALSLAAKHEFAANKMAPKATKRVPVPSQRLTEISEVGPSPKKLKDKDCTVSANQIQRMKIQERLRTVVDPNYNLYTNTMSQLNADDVHIMDSQPQETNTIDVSGLGGSTGSRLQPMKPTYVFEGHLENEPKSYLNLVSYQESEKDSRIRSLQLINDSLTDKLHQAGNEILGLKEKTKTEEEVHQGSGVVIATSVMKDIVSSSTKPTTMALALLKHLFSPDELKNRSLCEDELTKKKLPLYPEIDHVRRDAIIGRVMQKYGFENEPHHKSVAEKDMWTLSKGAVRRRIRESLRAYIAKRRC